MITYLTVIYLIILALIIAMIVWNLFTEEKLVNQINAAIVLIPLVLRLLLIK